MSLRIYIAEDEVINAMALKMALQQEGCQVCGTAAHGAAAIAGVMETRPDLLLMDINLGAGPNGIEAARLIQEQRPLPIIFMTGYADREILQQAQALSPVACLDKPIDTARLLELLRRLDPGSLPENGGVLKD
jgi:CheY-like chemotaxis protein